MLLVLSPSKTLDYESPLPLRPAPAEPACLSESEILVKHLRKLTPARLQKLMDISPKLAALNAERYRAFHTPFTPQNARPCLFAFKGDVYEGLQADALGAKPLAWLQSHLRILSGLYGLLRPYDLIQPYRLEMGIALKNPRGRNLYAFWGDRMTEALNADLKAVKSKVLVNLASNEYFRAVRPEKLNATVITPQFREKKNGEYKTVALFAKRARGLMARFMAEREINNPADLRDFSEESYRYLPKLSTAEAPVFGRG
jgi:cytoplasmic iron level regulating protein YaaA (DUF328/UPF0246 family)